MYLFWWFDSYFAVCDFLLYLGRVKDVEKISILNKYKKKYKIVAELCKFLDKYNINILDFFLDICSIRKEDLIMEWNSYKQEFVIFKAYLYFLISEFNKNVSIKKFDLDLIKLLKQKYKIDLEKKIKK